MTILDDIKHSFRQGDNLIRLIYVNLGVFIVVVIIEQLFKLMNSNGSFLVEWLAVPANPGLLLTRPWTLITYMFLHEGFYHILFNLVMLYFGGRLFVDYLGEKRLVTTYILGGISGALLYIVFFNVFPLFSNVLHFSRALGASASVLAIFIAIATYMPNFIVRLFFIFEVKLKYIAIGMILIDLASITSSNSGGHIAHLGGAAFGYYFIKRYQRGIDWSNGFYKWMAILGSLFKSKGKGKMKVAYKNPSAKAPGKSKQSVDQENIDRILDKISKSGYDSLTKEEKDLLFKASNN